MRGRETDSKHQHDYHIPAREVPSYDLLDPDSRNSNFRHQDFKVLIQSLDHLSAEASAQQIITKLKDAGMTYKGPIRTKGFARFEYRNLPRINGQFQYARRGRCHYRELVVQSSNYSAIGGLIETTVPMTVNITLTVI